MADAARPGHAELIAALPVAVLTLDPEGCIAQANAACEQLLNWSERAMQGASFTAVLPGQQRRADDFAVFDAEVETARGLRLRVDITGAELPERPGWRVVTLHPAGPRRFDRPPAGGRAAIGAAAMLAHEIRNPLSGIRGAAQLLGPGEMPALIMNEVDRIAGLIDRMQGFTDSRPLPLSAENIYPLLAHVRRVATAGFARDIIWEERFDPSLPRAETNRDALVQVLLNLVKNASEATEARADARIILATAYRHGMTVSAGPGRPRRALPIEISVVDNGPGAPADIADQLFDPFVSGRPEGQGLGLALVDKLVRDMGGLVRYSREGEPATTVFRLLLPRAA